MIQVAADAAICNLSIKVWPNLCRSYHFLLQFQALSILNLLRVQAHAHARIFAWLLGTCISETTADIAGNQTSMPRRPARAVHNANYER